MFSMLKHTVPHAVCHRSTLKEGMVNVQAFCNGSTVNSQQNRTPTHTDRSTFYEDLKKYRKSTGLCWLLNPEPPVVSKLPMPSIEDIIYSDEFLRARGVQE